MKFRKKPVVVEAVQFTPEMISGYCLREEPIPEGVVFRCGSWNQKTEVVHYAEFYVKTLDGEVDVTVGDWIITGENGKHYACDPDVFDRTYEKVEE